MSERSPIIVALDYAHPDQALAMADRLDPKQVRVKVGKELFTRGGPAVVEALHQRGFQVFLDLKFHDIPNTVVGAMRAAGELGVWMVNVHASGGSRMMTTARETLEPFRQRPLLIAVTVLTSQESADLAEIGITDGADAQVRRLAALTRDNGLDGVVCSAREAQPLRELCGDDFLLVTPGIRPASSTGDDQRRIVTPRQALNLGVDYMVIGRPITRAENPTSAVEEILQTLS